MYLAAAKSRLKSINIDQSILSGILTFKSLKIGFLNYELARYACSFLYDFWLSSENAGNRVTNNNCGNSAEIVLQLNSYRNMRQTSGGIWNNQENGQT